jgi:hypothetical protein
MAGLVQVIKRSVESEVDCGTHGSMQTIRSGCGRFTK